jgi:galactose mutarotase-like enzyme
MTSRHDLGATPDGRPVSRLVLGGEPGLELHLLALGATIHRLRVTGADGVRRDVALGHPSPADYVASDAYLGGTIGRYANRIRGGRFEVDGVGHQVPPNDRGNALHGGPEGFDSRVWDVVELTDDVAVLSLTSPDGDQGFPGRVEVTARFEVTADSLALDLTATTDAATVVNLTQHVYLNLDGEGSGTVDDHELTVPASRYTPVDGTGIPLGDHAAVDGTPFDLRTARRLGDLVRDGHEQLVGAQGIDHNLLPDGTGLREVARLRGPRSGTTLTLSSDQPGLQVYAGNFLDGTLPSRGGGRYRQGDGVALEPQLPPDSPNRPDPADPVLRPGQTYRWRAVWSFGS